MVDPSLVLRIKYVGVLNSMYYEEIPIEIFYRQVHRLWTNDMSLVNVLGGTTK